jgi:hypothetical protein
MLGGPNVLLFYAEEVSARSPRTGHGGSPPPPNARLHEDHFAKRIGDGELQTVRHQKALGLVRIGWSENVAESEGVRGTYGVQADSQTTLNGQLVCSRGTFLSDGGFRGTDKQAPA